MPVTLGDTADRQTLNLARQVDEEIEQRLQALYGSGASLVAGREGDHFLVKLAYTPGASTLGASTPPTKGCSAERTASALW